MDSGDAEKAEDAIMNVEDALSELKATFAEILNEKSFNEFSTDLQWIFMGDGAQKCKEAESRPRRATTEYKSETFRHLTP